MSRQLFLDTETTGLNAEDGDRVIEFGCVEMVNRRLTGRNLHFYFNPDRSSHPDAVRVHGITDEFLADKPRFGEKAQEIVEYIRGAEIVIHNAAFDVGFLNKEFERLGLGPFASHVDAITDSLLMAREQFPGKANSLDALCKRLEVDNTNRTLHGALLDAGLLAEVYIRMTRGQDSLVIDDHQQETQEVQADDADFSRLKLPVLAPTSEELEAHEKLLADLDKAAGGACQWRSLVL